MDHEASELLGIVLIAHGSRRAEANQELVGVAEQLRERGFARVFPAYLELAESDILTAGADAVAAGCGVIVLAPYFLSAGRHVVEDLEAARVDLAARFPTVRFAVAGPLGPDPLLVRLLEQRLAECLNRSQPSA